MNPPPFSGSVLAHLLRLASPLLPVGGYAYSQALEWAVEEGVVGDEPTALNWIRDALQFNAGTLEAPVWARLYRAWQAHDGDAARLWNARFLAMRETAELRAETRQMGAALQAVLQATGAPDPAPLGAIESPSFPCAFSFAAQGLAVPLREGLIAYLWAWAENQTAAAMKLVPLGQSSGQRMLIALGDLLPQVASRAAALPDEDLSNFSPALAIASSRHETQYTRLFRS